MPTGNELVRDINACQPGKGQLAFWWLGQHSFVVKAGGHTIYVDPFLSPYPGRLVPSLLAPAQATNATLISGSHDHADHIDRGVWPELAVASPHARFVVPDLLRERLAAELGIPPARFVGINDGQTVDADGVRISGVAAAHEFLDQDPATGKYPYMGFVFEVGDCAFYHPGDCCVYEGLLTKLKRWRLDVVFVPINGRDARRFKAGVIGNMTYQEAADLAGALQPGLAVPAHYDMFAGNQADPQAFAAYMAVKYPRQRVCVCEYGRRVLHDREQESGITA
jgi:L-ascorbate 6-phosphate lactonase